MSAELAVVSPGQLEAMQQHARLLASARSELVPPAFRGSPGDVLMAIEYGRSLNLPVAQIFTELYIVKGRPSMSAKLMMALVLRAGHRIRADVAGDGRSATCKITRTDDPDPYFEKFTLDDAVAAGLCEIKNGKVWARDQKGNPTPWERYTRTMLRNRAISTAVRAFCPDVLTSVQYTPDELQDDVGIVVDGTVSDPTDPGGKPEPAEEPVQASDEQIRKVAEENEAAWRTGWLDNLAAAARAGDLPRLAELGREAAAHGHSDLIDTARAAWNRVQKGEQLAGAVVDDQGDDDTGGASMDDDIVDAEVVEDGGDPS